MKNGPVIKASKDYPITAGHWADGDHYAAVLAHRDLLLQLLRRAREPVRYYAVDSCQVRELPLLAEIDAALAGTADQPTAAPRLTPEEQAVLAACEARLRQVMADFCYERLQDIPDDAVSYNPVSQALLSATRDWILKRPADNGSPAA